MSGKYYRTRSLSQNLQQIFHPHRQSHSRSINNLSVLGATGAVKSSTQNTLRVPHSLPQSPRILVESASSPFFPSIQLPSLNFSSPAQNASPLYPVINFISRGNEPPAKLKGFNLGEFRRNQYTRCPSIDLPKPLEKRLSWEERKKPKRSQTDRFQINDVLKENVELLRKYSEPKISLIHHESGLSSLSTLQSAFKAKLASLFKNKKKYTIAEPPSSGLESSDNYKMHRCDSCQSLPTLMTGSKKPTKHKVDKKDRKNLKQMKKSSLDRCRGEQKLNSLSLNPPHMIGGSFDNLLLINRMKKKRTMMGTYDTYHGRPLMSQASRLKALYKYRKQSESDDATTLSFEYDSGDMSDTSSIERSSSDEDGLSSFSDLTTKSSSYGYKMRSSNSVHSMPQMKVSKSRQSTAISPNRSLETPQFKSFDSGYRTTPLPNASNIPLKSIPYHLTHQMSAPTLYNRSDGLVMPPTMIQPTSLGQYGIRPNYYPSLSMPSANALANQYQNQMIKAFFTSGPASSNEFPLVSFTHSLKQEKKRKFGSI